MSVQIVEAGIEALPVIQNLVSLYVYDLSEIMGWRCPESGMFGGCDELPQYFGMDPSDPTHRLLGEWRGYPYLVRADGELAGFALVREIREDQSVEYEMGDFFILRKFRGSGVGRQVARALFGRFRGGWKVAQMVGNTPAQAFWRSVVSEYTGGSFVQSSGRDEVHGIELVVQRFVS